MLLTRASLAAFGGPQPGGHAAAEPTARIVLPSGVNAGWV